MPLNRTPTVGKSLETAGQHLVFTLGTECYALSLAQLRDVKAWRVTGHLAPMPHHQQGIIEVNGETVPVYDLNAPFRASPLRQGEAHVVLIATLTGRTVGLVIDTVMDLLEFDAKEVTLVPKHEGMDTSSLIHGIVQRDRQTIALIDIAPLVCAPVRSTVN